MDYLIRELAHRLPILPKAESVYRDNGVESHHYSREQLKNPYLANSIVQLLPSTLDPELISSLPPEDVDLLTAFQAFDLLHPWMENTTSIDIIRNRQHQLVGSEAKYYGNNYWRVHINGHNKYIKDRVYKRARQAMDFIGELPFVVNAQQFEIGELRQLMRKKTLDTPTGDKMHSREMKLKTSKKNSVDQTIDHVLVTRFALDKSEFQMEMNFSDLPPNLSEPVMLDASHAEALQAFYEKNSQWSSFEERWLEKGHYFGIFDAEGNIVSAAGGRDGVLLPNGRKIFLASDLATDERYRKSGLARRCRHAMLKNLFTNPEHKEWWDSTVVFDAQTEKSVNFYLTFGAHSVSQTIWGVWKTIDPKSTLV